MEYKIYVGALIAIKKGLFKGSLKIMYCGMPNETTFTLSPFATKGYQGFSPNIYFDKDARVIHVFEQEFDVLEVTPDYIILGD